MKDQYLGTMFQNLLTTHIDTYHPDLSLTLVNSVKSYVSSKLDYERKTPDFITELRRRLYLIHEYNCQVAKLTHKYPRTRKFDSLLVKYVELEFESLYSTPHPPKHLEDIAELRVLRLLQVMLHQAVLDDRSLINDNADIVLKRAVLRLLGEVKPAYLVENKLVHNIANKLLKKVNGVNYEVQCLGLEEIHRNLATSDYGTDDDSDFENDIFSKTVFDTKFKKDTSIVPTSDCLEVPVTIDGEVPIPTVEFADDDDDNYMVYLQKKFRKRFENQKSQTVSNKTGNTDSAKEKISQNIENLTNPKGDGCVKTDCVIVCSDSEEENFEEKKSGGVVTFELIDDDDSDDELNYMVYLQKEVKTNNSKQKRKIDPKEIIVCSDSEDELVVETIQNIEVPVVTPQDSQETQNAETDVQETENVAINEEEILDNILNLVDTRPQDKVDTITSIQVVPTFPEENLLQPLQNEVDKSETNFLIDPAIIFEAVANPCISPTTLALTSQYDRELLEELDVDKLNSLGGPLLGEKSDDVDLQECRINDSVLELLLDDNYLLEGRKEFEELECFLFNDGKELEFCNFEKYEPLLRPEDFEALLNEPLADMSEACLPKSRRDFRKRRKRKGVVRVKRKTVFKDGMKACGFKSRGKSNFAPKGCQAVDSR